MAEPPTGATHFAEKTHKVQELLGSLSRRQTEVPDQESAIHIFLVSFDHWIAKICRRQFTQPAVARWGHLVFADIGGHWAVVHLHHTHNSAESDWNHQ